MLKSETRTDVDIDEMFGYSRRSWLGRAVAGATGLALSLTGCGSQGADGITDALGRDQHQQRLIAKNLTQFSPRLLRTAPETPLGRFSLSSAPAGFSFAWALIDPEDGFLEVSSSFSVSYVDHSFKHGDRHPLVLYFGMGADAVLASTELAIPADTFGMSINGLGNVHAKYFDGMWAMPTEKDDSPLGKRFWAYGRGHSVVCQGTGYAVAARGSVITGTSREVLIGALRSVTFT